jgi:aryl-alcohol dehydrogenase-like predicted oxidoreductase
MPFDQSGAQPREQLAATVRAAVDAGVRLLDTADAYGRGDDLGAQGKGENERLIAGLLDELGLRSEVLSATKGGQIRTDGGGWAGASSPKHLRAAVDASLQRLGVDPIVRWQHHRRSSRPEIDVCEDLGLAFLPWSPLGRLKSAKGLADKHRVQRSGRPTRRQGSAPRSRVGARPVRVCHPDPRGQTSRIDHGLSGRRRPLTLARRSRRLRRRLTVGRTPTATRSRAQVRSIVAADQHARPTGRDRRPAVTGTMWRGVPYLE